MVTMDAAARMAMQLPDVVEGTRWGNRTWNVGGKSFAWERPFSKADVKRFLDEPVPEGPILAVVVEDLGEKEAVLATGIPGFFTIPHFNGYAAILIQLRAVTTKALREALVDGWLACAPADLAAEFLKRRRGRRAPRQP
jgi:hypothetical protein